MAYINPIEVPKRMMLLKSVLKACGGSAEDFDVDRAYDMTSTLTIEQLERATDHVIRTHDGKSRASIINRVFNAVDRGTRDRQRVDDAAREPRVLPLVTIDTRRMKTQLAILQRHAKPMSRARWSEKELDDIRVDLAMDADNAKLAQSWIDRERERRPSVVLDEATFGPPPDETSDAIPSPVRKIQLVAQLRARLSRLADSGAMPRRVPGVTPIGGVVLREPGAEG